MDRLCEPEFGGRNDGVASRSRIGLMRRAAALAVVALMLAACQPTVKVEAPDKPIVINLNVKIEQEVRVKVDREVEELLKTQPDLF
jgi:hypothetical protein